MVFNKKNKTDIILWIITLVAIVGLMSGYFDGRADKETNKSSKEIKIISE